ncbi:condensation protein [Leptospira barantonii]|uniref:Condensation protein n=1 Tax=Leptospira barantonii TaxID=2023184 RepID=A0A5F2BUT3_9LEPT|nr:condensation domain-containing protein [Leptospira barantonii]TGM10151.1 condensation protein [Leptospira barantonii]
MQNTNDLEKIETKKRSLDKAESAFWLLDQASSMNFAVIAEGNGEWGENEIKKALDCVQSKHPLANARIELENGASLTFKIDTENRIPIVNLRSEETKWKDLVAEKTILPFSWEDSPLIRSLMIKLEADRWIFVLIFHHSIADGRSGSSFMIDVLNVSIEDLEKSNIQNSMEIPNSAFSLLPGQNDTTLNPNRKNSDAPKTEKIKTGTIPSFSKKKESAKPSLYSFQIDETELEKLLIASKQNGTTLHGILGAVQLFSLRNIVETEDPILLNLSNPADLKPYLNKGTSAAVLGLYITLLTVEVPIHKGSDFWEVARKISSSLKSQLGDPNERTRFYDLLPSTEQILNKPNGIPFFSALLQKYPQASALSNVGILPSVNKFKNRNIQNVSFTVHPSLSQPVFVSASTYEGKLTIYIHSDSNRWIQKDSERFRSEFEEKLRKLARS